MIHALLNVLLGMGSVFIVLIIICLLIYCFNIIPYIENKFKGKNEIQAVPKTEKTVVENQTNTTNDEEVVAAIMAAITAYTGMSQDDFVVRSIIRR